MGLFPIAAFFNHSCDANAEVVACSNPEHPEGVLSGIVIRALKSISIGDEITINYVSVFVRMWMSGCHNINILCRCQ